MPRKATDQELATFALSHFEDLPIARRAALCRRLAELVIDREVSTRLLAQATALEDIAEDHDQLLLNLRGGGR